MNEDAWAEPRLSEAPVSMESPPPSGRLSVGSVFADSVGILSRFAVPIFFVVVVFTALLSIVELAALSKFENHPTPVDAWAEAPASGISLIVDVLQYVLAYFLQGMLTFIVLQHLRGRSPNAMSAIASGFGRTLGVLPLSLFVSTIVGVLLAAGSKAGILTILPAIVIQCGWFVAVPVAVAERAGLGTALTRSWTLTARNKWRIFLVQLVFGLAGGVLVMLFFIMYMDRPDRANDYASLRTALLISNAIMVPFIALLAISAPVAYQHLRREKEGADVEPLAEVFD